MKHVVHGQELVLAAHLTAQYWLAVLECPQREQPVFLTFSDVLQRSW